MRMPNSRWTDATRLRPPTWAPSVASVSCSGKNCKQSRQPSRVRGAPELSTNRAGSWYCSVASGRAMWPMQSSSGAGSSSPGSKRTDSTSSMPVACLITSFHRLRRR
uniref:(northern house mosquito) hypothetical protein n=1 Tax=Culex pipiens TaxID=7175 RepID=A0A8D8A2E5_CULPI